MMKRLSKSITFALSFTLIVSLLSMVIPAGAQSIVLRYANWNLGTQEENNIQRQLVAAYMEAHPNVTIELVDMSGDGGWEEKLTNLAARGALPDVFMANNTPYYVSSDWTADLTDLVANDPDWQHVPQALVDAVTYSGRVLALPSAQFVMGYFINQDLFEFANLDAPTYGIEADEFFATVTQLTDVQQGVLGLHEVEPILGWYGHTLNPDLGWFSFDGTHMNYNSDAFRAATEIATRMLPHTWTGLSEEQRSRFASQGPWELFVNQESGAVWEGGWAVPAFVANASFDWDFMGIPGGTQALVADLLVVSSATADLEAAYDFARWMSFSIDGYRREAELAAANGVVPTRMPVAITDETIDLYMSFMGDRPGLRRALENLDNSLIESLAKIVPGYINARWEGRPGVDIGDNANVNIGFILSNVWTGSYKFTDYSARLEEYANSILDEARAALSR